MTASSPVPDGCRGAAAGTDLPAWMVRLATVAALLLGFEPAAGPPLLAAFVTRLGWR